MAAVINRPAAPARIDLMNTQAELIDCLQDLYAMEKNMEEALSKLTVPPHCHAALRDQAAQHCTETRRHAEVIASFLKQLGSETSSGSRGGAQDKNTNFINGAGRSFAGDERLKDVIAVLLTEHFEIACHTILRTGAAHLGLRGMIRSCDQILVEKKRMVKWLQLNLPQIFATYLASDNTAANPGETEIDLRVGGISDDMETAHWEFVQLAQNVSLFGGPLPRSLFASMRV